MRGIYLANEIKELANTLVPLRGARSDMRTDMHLSDTPLPAASEADCRSELELHIMAQDSRAKIVAEPDDIVVLRHESSVRAEALAGAGTVSQDGSPHPRSRASAR